MPPIVELEDASEAGDEAPTHEVIMAIDMKDNATIGCAYFNTRDSNLNLSEDIPMASLDVAEQFLIHAQPTTVLLSARAPVSFHDFLEKQANAPELGMMTLVKEWIDLLTSCRGTM